MDNIEDRGLAHRALSLMVEWNNIRMKDVFRKLCFGYNYLIPSIIKENNKMVSKKNDASPRKHCDASLFSSFQPSPSSVSTGTFGKVCN